MEQENFTNHVLAFFHLLGLYLNKKEASYLKMDQENLPFFIKLAKYHSLSALFFKAVKETNVDVSPEDLKKLEEPYLLNVRKSALFAKERKALYQYLNDNQIDFLPLKGIVIKDYWLDPDSREFADNDILFPDEKSKMVKAYFVESKYEVEYYKKSNHDVYLKKPFFNFEMHRNLFGEIEDAPKLIGYFANYLKDSAIKEGYEHYLSDENFYIYFTAHSYKHFHQSGCGIRTLVDYYVFLKKHSDLNFKYIDKELKKIDLLDFSNLIKTLAIKVFDDEKLTKEERETLLFIASSGTYGTLQHSVQKGVKEKGRFGYFISRVFPPLSFYKSAYPWAYKSKVLIPVAWLMRFFRILFKNPKKATQEIKMISKTKKED